MTSEQITAEVAKLNRSQRNALRNAIGGGRIDSLTVTKRGSYTEVRAAMYGNAHWVMIGSRGKVFAREVFA
jgi:hypothetical protein